MQNVTRKKILITGLALSAFLAVAQHSRNAALEAQAGSACNDNGICELGEQTSVCPGAADLYQEYSCSDGCADCAFFAPSADEQGGRSPLRGLPPPPPAPGCNPPHTICSVTQSGLPFPEGPCGYPGVFTQTFEQVGSETCGSGRGICGRCVERGGGEGADENENGIEPCVTAVFPPPSRNGLPSDPVTVRGLPPPAIPAVLPGPAHPAVEWLQQWLRGRQTPVQGIQRTQPGNTGTPTPEHSAAGTEENQGWGKAKWLQEWLLGQPRSDDAAANGPVPPARDPGGAILPPIRGGGADGGTRPDLDDADLAAGEAEVPFTITATCPCRNSFEYDCTFQVKSNMDRPTMPTISAMISEGSFPSLHGYRPRTILHDPANPDAPIHTSPDPSFNPDQSGAAYPKPSRPTIWWNLAKNRKPNQKIPLPANGTIRTSDDTPLTVWHWAANAPLSILNLEVRNDLRRVKTSFILPRACNASDAPLPGAVETDDVPACGNGLCDGNEHRNNCRQDCFCGNGLCERGDGEDRMSCAADCRYGLQTACIDGISRTPFISFDGSIITYNTIHGDESSWGHLGYRSGYLVRNGGTPVRIADWIELTSSNGRFSLIRTEYNSPKIYDATSGTGETVRLPTLGGYQQDGKVVGIDNTGRYLLFEIKTWTPSTYSTTTFTIWDRLTGTETERSADDIFVRQKNEESAHIVHPGVSAAHGTVRLQNGTTFSYCPDKIPGARADDSCERTGGQDGLRISGNGRRFVYVQTKTDDPNGGFGTPLQRSIHLFDIDTRQTTIVQTFDVCTNAPIEYSQGI